MALQDEYMNMMQQTLAQFKDKHPEFASHPGLSLSTHTPGIHFLAACKGHLDAKDYERFSAAMGRYMGQNGPPSSDDGSDIFDEVGTECRALLAGREDLQARWDEVYGPRANWQRVNEAIKQVQSED